jgi:hypothetical protein
MTAIRLRANAAVHARALTRGAQFPPLILVGKNQRELVCLEGHPRLTAYALAGFRSMSSAWSAPRRRWDAGLS